MNRLTSINATQLAIGIQAILLDMLKKHGKAQYPIAEFERLIMDEKQIDRKDAELVTEKVINTGILRWSIHNSMFVL